MKVIRLLLPFILLVALMSVVFFARAVCDPFDTGTAGNDIINCTVANPPTGNIQGNDGDDTIIIDSGVNSAIDVGGDYVGVPTLGTGDDTIVNNGAIGRIVGDSDNNGNGTGNDTIINNGSATFILGDVPGTFGSVASGNDVIINNGSVSINLTGDTGFGDGSGSDSITNNGSVAGSIYGDTISGIGSGNDTITNNGSTTNIYSDEQAGTGTGNDTITNNGAVNGSIIAGGGDDAVIIQANDSTVSGTIDGGGDADTLTFDLRSTSPEQLDAWAAEIAAANPNGGTITLNGHSYTWTNFEDLQSILHLTSIEIEGEMRPFCAAGGGLDIYIAVGDEGIFSLYASAERISDALTYARTYEVAVTVETSETSQLWALTTGELQIRTAEGEIVSTFSYQTHCGELPEGNAELYMAPAATVEEEELPPFSIINQPYGG